MTSLVTNACTYGHSLTAVQMVDSALALAVAGELHECTTCKQWHKAIKKHRQKNECAHDKGTESGPLLYHINLSTIAAYVITIPTCHNITVKRAEKRDWSTTPPGVDVNTRMTTHYIESVRPNSELKSRRNTILQALNVSLRLEEEVLIFYDAKNIDICLLFAGRIGCLRWQLPRRRCATLDERE